MKLNKKQKKEMIISLLARVEFLNGELEDSRETIDRMRSDKHYFSMKLAKYYEKLKELGAVNDDGEVE